MKQKTLILRVRSQVMMRLSQLFSPDPPGGASASYGSSARVLLDLIQFNGVGFLLERYDFECVFSQPDPRS